MNSSFGPVESGDLFELIELNFKYLPVGNAYPEFTAKLVKQSTSSSRVHTDTLARHLRARGTSHAWGLEDGDLALVKRLLHHNAPTPQPKPSGVFDASHLKNAMVGGGGDQPEYAALKIWGHKVEDKVDFYYVQWRGFDEDGRGCVTRLLLLDLVRC